MALASESVLASEWCWRRSRCWCVLVLLVVALLKWDGVKVSVLVWFLLLLGAAAGVVAVGLVGFGV